MPPPCSSFVRLWSFPFYRSLWHRAWSWQVTLDKIWVEDKTEWKQRSFVRTPLKHECTVKSCGSFPPQTGFYFFLTPQAAQTTFILPSHLIIQRFATQLPVAFLEMPWLFSFPWGLALCSVLIFSKLCWLITVFLSILFLKWPLHLLEQPGHQTVEWKLEQCAVKAFSWKINK